MTVDEVTSQAGVLAKDARPVGNGAYRRAHDVVKLGDQGARAPSTHEEPTIITQNMTTATAQGRRRGLRSPRFDISGTTKRMVPATRGPPMMT